MQKAAVCSAMHGEQTSPESIARLQEAMENQVSDQFEIQLYKKNSYVSFSCVEHLAQVVAFGGLHYIRVI